MQVRRRSLGGDPRGASGLDSVPEGQPLHRSYTLPPTLEVTRDEAQDESRDNWLNMPQDMDMQVTFMDMLQLHAFFRKTCAVSQIACSSAMID